MSDKLQVKSETQMLNDELTCCNGSIYFCKKIPEQPVIEFVNGICTFQKNGSTGSSTINLMHRSIDVQSLLCSSEKGAAVCSYMNQLVLLIDWVFRLILIRLGPEPDSSCVMFEQIVPVSCHLPASNLSFIVLRSCLTEQDYRYENWSDVIKIYCCLS